MSAWLAGLEVVPTIVCLRGTIDHVRETELARLDGKLEQLSSAQGDEVEQLTVAIVNKILHVSTVRLRELVAERDAYVYVDALQRLFDLSGVAPACERERLVSIAGDCIPADLRVTGGAAPRSSR